ncbi:MAG: cytochrome P450 [Solirubrobacterales bacterium]|nr:cytochrome P450 [Solirubrobacterales bacterium]
MSSFDRASVIREVLVPLAARGLILRRPRMVRRLARGDADRRAISRLEQLRTERGPEPLLLSVAGRRLAVVLDPDHARDVLARTPDPFTPATTEKRSALGRFEPHGVLISRRANRPLRRELNTAALDSGHAHHRLSTALNEAVDSTAVDLSRAGELDWTTFNARFQALARVLVLGPGAAADTQLTDLLATLRADANWAYASPLRRRKRRRLLARIGSYAGAPEDSLLSHLLSLSAAGDPDAHALEQVPHWLFAFDAAAIASYTALALLALRPDDRAQALEESDPTLPYLRACVLETLRLWPTTPALLRDATTDTELGETPIPKQTTLLIYPPLFHRDPRLEPDPDLFRPRRWLADGQVQDRPDTPVPLIPFSDKDARCPAQELVLAVTSRLLSGVLENAELLSPQMGSYEALVPGRPLPATLDHQALRFRVSASTPQATIRS